jgi:hypothetical protein
MSTEPEKDLQTSLEKCLLNSADGINSPEFSKLCEEAAKNRPGEILTYMLATNQATGEIVSITNVRFYKPDCPH